MGLREILGLDRIVLAQSSLYGPGNGGRDQGMPIDTCLQILKTQGALSVDVIDQYDWQGYWRKTWPDEWQVKAKRVRVLEWRDCPTLQHALSAVCDGYPVLYGSKGHAVVRIANDKDKNSWRADWGEFGDGIGLWATRKEMERDIPDYGAWAACSVTDPSGDGDIVIPRTAA